MLSATNMIRAEIIRAAIPRVIASPYPGFNILSHHTCEELASALEAIFVDQRDPVNYEEAARDFRAARLYPEIRYLTRKGLIRESVPQFGTSSYYLTSAGRKVARRLGFPLPSRHANAA